MRGPFSYYGGKARIAAWIASHFPPHAYYVDLFGGAASVLLAKPPALMDVYNDIDSRLVTFFRVLRDYPDALVRAIDLTPYSRAEFIAARALAADQERAAGGQRPQAGNLQPAHSAAGGSLLAGDQRPQPAPGPQERADLETARRFYVLMKQGNFPGRDAPSWRWQERRGRSMVGTWNSTAHLYDIAAQLKAVQLEQGDWSDVLGRYDHPDALFYADPPYLAGERTDHSHGYPHEMGSEAQHRALIAALAGAQGMAVLSGYPCELYDSLLAGWQRFETRMRDASTKIRVEALWLSPSAWARLQAAPPIPEQMTFWECSP